MKAMHRKIYFNFHQGFLAFIERISPPRPKVPDDWRQGVHPVQILLCASSLDSAVFKPLLTVNRFRHLASLRFGLGLGRLPPRPRP